MQKKLSVVGNSLGLIIEKPVLDLLRIDKDTPLEITTDGDVLIIRPVRDAKTERVREAALRMAQAHTTTFEKIPCRLSNLGAGMGRQGVVGRQTIHVVAVAGACVRNSVAFVIVYPKHQTVLSVVEPLLMAVSGI